MSSRICGSLAQCKPAIATYSAVMSCLHQQLIQIRRLTKYYAELGAKCTTMRDAERMRANLTKTEASQHKIARVHLPLQFPKLKRGAR